MPGKETGKCPSPTTVGGLLSDPQLLDINKEFIYSMQLSEKIFTHPSTLLVGNTTVEIPNTLIDSGASSCFIDLDFVKNSKIQVLKKETPVMVEVVDGKALGTGKITEETTPLLFSILGHEEYISFNVIKSPSYPIILGIPWLTFHNPEINWRERTLQFNCSCVPQRNSPVGSASSFPASAPAPTFAPSPVDVPKAQEPIIPIEPAPGAVLRRSPDFEIPDNASIMEKQSIPAPTPPRVESPIPQAPSPIKNKNPLSHYPDFEPPPLPADGLPPSRGLYAPFAPFARPSSPDPPRPPPPMRRGYRAPSSTDTSPAPSPVPKPFPRVNTDVPALPVPLPIPSSRRGYAPPSSTESSPEPNPPRKVMQPNKISLRPQSSTQPIESKGWNCTISTLDVPPPSKEKAIQSIPRKYAAFADVFSKEKADILPQHRKYDCSIDIKDGKQPPFGPIYNLTQPELKALREYIDENLAKGFIRNSRSPAGAPILFVKKKDGSLRLCVDYRGLNALTIKNRYPLPLISQLLDQLSQAKIFTKIDLRGAYNLVRVKAGDEWKTAFRTRYGHFEYTVMPFGLTNAPAVFQHMMNDIFREQLDHYVVIYLDDLLIYSKNQEEHDSHVTKVLEKLREVGLYAKLEKCEFDKTSVEFLGYVVTPQGIRMDQSKVDSLLSWKPPSTVREVQCFLGFANFYRIFIKNFSSLVSPLTALTRKDKKFEWDSKAQRAFEDLKRQFTTAPILTHANPERQYIVETDGSDFAMGAVLSQLQDDGKLHPIAFYSRKFTAAEINYEIYDKELLAIVSAFEQWRHYLCGAQCPIVVFTDHKNLLYYTTTRKLNRRQARWSMFLADFDFEIKYRPGAQQGKPDALSRREEYKPKEGEDCVTNQHTVLIKPEKLHINGIVSTPDDESLLSGIRDNLKKDKFASGIMKHIKEFPEFSITNGLLFNEGLLYVPDLHSKLEILKNRHDSKIAGHYGVKKTVELITRDYWWPKLWEFVRRYIKGCDTCARSKSSRHKPYGLLMPLEVPKKPWESISMDFITDLPKSNGHDAILVVVDRFSKMAHFIPCSKKISAKTTAKLILQHIVKLHGLPRDIVTDRGPQFHSKFWKNLFGLLGTKVSLSSAFHPQSDGQSERVNQILEQYLRCTINYLQSNWCEALPLAEFSYNNTIHSSTQKSPFYANYGFHPRFDFNQLATAFNPAAERVARDLEKLHKDVKEQLETAQRTMKKYADIRRVQAPLFKPGNLVWLLRKFVKTTRPCEKLDYRKLGPYKVIEQINPVTFRLELPPSIRIHDAFHVSLLEPYEPNEFPERETIPPPAIEVNGHMEHEVEEILDSRILRNKLYYLVHWAGHDISERTWEPLENLGNTEELVKEFHQKNPGKPSHVDLPRGQPFRRR